MNISDLMRWTSVMGPAFLIHAFLGTGYMFLWIGIGWLINAIIAYEARR